MTASAVCFAAIGILLLFAAEEVSALLGLETSNHSLHELLGAALLGFAAMDWIARGSALGGIYGRAVVAGNQTHLTVGAILLVKRGVENTSSHPVYWTIAGFYVLGAAYFAYFTFFSSGIEKQS
jgi:hypothetical protein